VQDVPDEERSIKTLVNHVNLRELGLLHPGRGTGRAPVIPVDEAAPAGEDVEIAPTGKTEEQGAVGEGREEEEEEAGDEESSGSEDDSDSNHKEEGPEAPPPAEADVVPTSVPSPFVSDQGSE